MLRVGILGVGAIGRTIATAIDQNQVNAQLVALSDQQTDAARELSSQLASRPPVLSIDEVLEQSDLAIEAASQAALATFVPTAIAHGRDILVLSVGGLLGHEDWFRQATERGCKIYIPSGAIAGLDGIKSGSVGRIDCATLTSRKPIAALRGTKYVVEQKIDLDAIATEQAIFEGTAEEAARAFPSTSNVAASLRLAVRADAPVRVQVVAVPGGTKNVHEIAVQGEFGKLSIAVENVPSKTNPRTSQLAAYSAIATLKNLTQSVRVGT